MGYRKKVYGACGMHSEEKSLNTSYNESYLSRFHEIQFRKHVKPVGNLKQEKQLHKKSKKEWNPRIKTCGQ